MKSIFLFLTFFCITIIAAGCGKPEENAVATEGATADDFARYEEELAAVSGDDSYAEEEGNDDATE